MATTTIVRDHVIKALQELPEKTSLEAIMSRVEMIAAIDAGLDDIKAGRTYTQAEVEEKILGRRLA
jgi:predicted transcriptional regulator